MGLSYFIEYLLTLQRPGGGNLLYEGWIQTIVAAFPPAISLSRRSTPRQGSYATIWFRSYFSPTMVPNAFTGWIQQYGATLASGVASQLVIDQGIDYFVVVTEAQPFLEQYTNISGLTQYFEGVSLFLSVSSKEDYDLLVKELDKLRMGNLEALAVQANALLGKMAQALIPSPKRPPT